MYVCVWVDIGGVCDDGQSRRMFLVQGQYTQLEVLQNSRGGLGKPNLNCYFNNACVQKDD